MRLNSTVVRSLRKKQREDILRCTNIYLLTTIGQADLADVPTLTQCTERNVYLSVYDVQKLPNGGGFD